MPAWAMRPAQQPNNGNVPNKRPSFACCLQDGSGFKALLKGSMPAWAVQEAGAPAEVWLDIQAPEDTDSLLLDVIWVNKTATRLPEVPF